MLNLTTSQRNICELTGIAASFEHCGWSPLHESSDPAVASQQHGADAGRDQEEYAAGPHEEEVRQQQMTATAGGSA